MFPSVTLTFLPPVQFFPSEHIKDFSLLFRFRLERRREENKEVERMARKQYQWQIGEQGPLLCCVTEIAPRQRQA